MPIDYRTYQLSKSEIIRCCALCFAGMLVIAALFFDSVWPGIILSPSLYYCLPIFAKIKCEKRLKVLREEFVDFLYSLSSSVATGMHMSEAIAEARDSLWVTFKGQSLLADELSEMLVKKLDFSKVEEGEEESKIRSALVGKPNTGKSTLANRLTHSEASIVSDYAGTTRDIVEGDFEYKGQKFHIIDTAGIRRKAKVHENVEYYSVNRAIKSF